MSIDAGKWTSDWYVAREIHAAYEDSRKENLCIICLGDPATPGGYLVEPVGEALAEYHPNVFGTLGKPVHEGNLAQRWAEHGELWRSCFESSSHRVVGTTTISDSSCPAGHRGRYSNPGSEGIQLGHIVLYATIFFAGLEAAGVPANPHLEKRAAKAADVVVDGVLRFLHKIEYDRHAVSTHVRSSAGQRCYPIGAPGSPKPSSGVRAGPATPASSQSHRRPSLRLPSAHSPPTGGAGVSG